MEKDKKGFCPIFHDGNDVCVDVKHVVESWICIGFSHYSFEVLQFVVALEKFTLFSFPHRRTDYMLFPTLI